MKDTPLVSIIVLCYNFEKYIGDCIRSIIAQRYDNIELIIFDDGSRDGSVDVIRSLEHEVKKRGYKTNFIYNSQNEYSSKNWNHLIMCSSGKYIKFMDGDDFLLENCIEIEVKYLEEHPFCGMVYTDYICITENTKYSDDLQHYEKKSAMEVCEKMAQKIYEKMNISAPTVLRRKEIYDIVGYYDERIRIADWGNYIDIALNYEVGCIHTVTAAYRLSPDSASRFRNNEAGRNALMNMVNSEIIVLDKYKNDSRINSRPGIENICNQAISVAIDIAAKDVVDLIKNYIASSGCKFNPIIRAKIKLYEEGWWNRVQAIRSRLRLIFGKKK